IMECNCSICSRDGALWIYPPTSTITFQGLDSLAEYAYGNITTYHGFCKTCGVAIRERFLPGAPEPKWSDGTALNIRVINGLDLAALEVERYNGKADLPAYEV
ncbi:hypothetical protein FB451DRAFT_1048679, partial [Mycena latifolia]